MIIEKPHAQCSPSGASGWMHCAGWTPKTSTFANEDTAAHQLAQWCLTNNKNTSAFIGKRTDSRVEITADIASDTQRYVETIRELGDQRLIEQTLNISFVTGESNAVGTADAIIFRNKELIIADLKFGRGIRAEAENNEQLQIYALAALNEFDYLEDYDRVRLMIIQPRLNNISEWVIGLEELNRFAEQVILAANRKLTGDTQREPSQKACQWCANKATCPTLTQFVLSNVADDFVDVSRPIAPQIKPALTRTFDNTVLGQL